MGLTLRPNPRTSYCEVSWLNLKCSERTKGLSFSLVSQHLSCTPALKRALDIPFKICRILLPISLPTYMFSHHIYHHHIFREEMEDVVGSVFDLMGRTSDPILEEEVINERVDHLFEVNCLLKHWWILFCWTSFIYSEWISMEMVWSHLMSFWKLAWEMNTLPDQLSNLVLLWFKLPKIIIDVSHKYTLEF